MPADEDNTETGQLTDSALICLVDRDSFGLKKSAAESKAVDFIKPNRHCLKLLCLLTSRPHIKTKRPIPV